MKKSRLINSEITAVIARMGHLDELTICDAGLPIPKSTPRIDLAISQNLPPLLSVLEAVFSELQVESVIIARECQTQSPNFYQRLMAVIDQQNPPVAVALLSHSELKAQTSNSQAIVRTGEYTPFANIILKSGVVF
ncbi:MAG: ribose ABC superfamily ATP binding cassette transporter, membrane protein [Osedax symbiont Rs2]|nr:MAG: ribose ABC superfamily ATP binding cassette transporter, membrane protein [Osedax symbiont Rs2]